MSRERVARRREENEVEFSRIVAFSDGVFAIAITLLVLNLSVPERIPGDDLNDVLWDQRHDLLAYVISFGVIGRFWILHHRFFASVVGFDARLLGLNLFYLGWIALLPFSSQILGDHGGDSAAIVLYAINLSGATLVGMLMSADARRAGLSKDAGGGGAGRPPPGGGDRGGLPRLGPGRAGRPRRGAAALAGALPRPARAPRAASPHRLSTRLSRVWR